MHNARTILKVLGWVWVFLILPFAWVIIQIIGPLSRKEFPQNLYDTTLGFLFLPGLPIILTCSLLGLLLLATIITGIITLFGKKEDALFAPPMTLDTITSTAVQRGRGVFVANTQDEKYRRSVLDLIRSVWITGFLESSPEQANPLQLRLRRRLDMVTNPWGEEIQEITQFPQLLPKGTEIIDVYHEAGGKLLILEHRSRNRAKDWQNCALEGNPHHIRPEPLFTLSVMSWRLVPQASDIWPGACRPLA